MTEDLAAERLPSRQHRQRAVLDEGGDAYNGVMAPVVAVPPLPERQPLHQGGGIEPCAELLHPGKQGLAPDGIGHGLDDAGAGVGIHQADQGADGAGAHDAVGIQHDHVVILAAPAPAELQEVADLAALVGVAAAVMQRRAAPMADPGLHGVECRLFLSRNGGIAGVGQHEQVHSAQGRAGNSGVHRLDGGENRPRVLLVDRHHQRRTGQPGGLRRHLQSTAGAAHQEAKHRRPAGQSHVKQVDRQQSQQRPTQRIGQARRQLDGQQGSQHD